MTGRRAASYGITRVLDHERADLCRPEAKWRTSDPAPGRCRVTQPQSPQVHPRIPQGLYDRVKALSVDGEVGEFADGLVEIAGLTGTSWDLRELLKGAPVDRWLAVYRRVSDARVGQLRPVPNPPLWDAIRESVPPDVPAEVLHEILDDLGQEFYYYPYAQLAALARAWLATGAALPPTMIGVIRRSAIDEEKRNWPDTGCVLPELLAELTGLPPVNPGEVWADRVLAELPELGADWQALVDHAATATSDKPSARWENRGRELLDLVGPDRTARVITSWLRLVGQPRSMPLSWSFHRDHGEQRYDPHNEVVLRGLVWLLGFTPATPDSARTLGELVPTALRRSPWSEHLISPVTARAGVYALSRLADVLAVEELAGLTHRLTVKSVLKDVDTAITRQTVALGITRAEVEELGIPAYGLTGVGHRTSEIGGVTAALTVTGAGVDLTWRDGTGKVIKSPPPAVRKHHTVAIRDLRAETKRIGKALAAQINRLEREMTAERVWTYDIWCQRYLDHPLVGVVARQLIWTVDGQSCGYADGALRGLDDRPLTPAPDAPVSLWHPLRHTEDEVAAWRSWLDRHGIRQPVEQAHRPVVRPS